MSVSGPYGGTRVIISDQSAFMPLAAIVRKWTAANCPELPPRDVFKLLEGHCFYCGGPAESDDHVVPRSKGGRTCRGNIVPSCRHCNASKCDATFEEFRQRRSTRWFSDAQRSWLAANGFELPEPSEFKFWGELHGFGWIVVPPQWWPKGRA